jgi:hypothetical protein
MNHENVTTQLYPGTEREFLVTNVIFRLGGAACLLTNKAAEKRRAKYALEQCLRTHTGADDDAFSCMSVKLDPHGVPGVFLPPPATLAAVTKKAMTANVTRLGAHGRAHLCLSKFIRAAIFIVIFLEPAASPSSRTAPTRSAARDAPLREAALRQALARGEARPRGRALPPQLHQVL